MKLSELLQTTNQTPIEIALGIDEQGMTTARKLYEFLELNPSNYSKWVKRNIIENEFAEDNKDYYSYQRTSEGKGNFANDYKLTSDFAKKLSMTAKNEKGEQARDYFVTVENKARDTQLQLQNLSSELRFMINAELKLNQHDKRIESVEEKIVEMKENQTLSQSDYSEVNRQVRKQINKVIKEEPLFVGKHLTRKQRDILFNELRRDICTITCVRKYNHIKNKDYYNVIDFIGKWQPSRATVIGIVGYEQQNLRF